MKKLFILLFVITLGLRAFTQNYTSFDEMKENIVSKTMPLITVEELKKVENTKKPLLILDAREQNEFNVSHIKNAKYVGYDRFKIKDLKGLDKQATIVIYCSVGYRSEKIAEYSSCRRVLTNSRQTPSGSSARSRALSGFSSSAWLCGLLPTHQPSNRIMSTGQRTRVHVSEGALSSHDLSKRGNLHMAPGEACCRQMMDSRSRAVSCVPGTPRVASSG